MIGIEMRYRFMTLIELIWMCLFGVNLSLFVVGLLIVGIPFDVRLWFELKDVAFVAIDLGIPH